MLGGRLASPNESAGLTSGVRGLQYKSLSTSQVVNLTKDASTVAKTPSDFRINKMQRCCSRANRYPIGAGMGLTKETVDEWTKQIVTEVPMKRFGQPEEIAKTVLFLASSDASYITGVEVNVDGGVGQV